MFLILPVFLFINRSDQSVLCSTWERRSRNIMFYDTIKLFFNNIGRKFNKFKPCSIRPCRLVSIGRLNYLIYVFKKLIQSGKTFLFMNTTLGWFFLRFNDFFTIVLSWHWELGLPIAEGRFPEVVSTIFMS